MQNILNDPQAAVELAINNELEGYQILKDAEESVNDLRAKATFEFLASQELLHIEVIKEFSRALGTHESWASRSFQQISQQEVKEQIRSIFERFKIQFEDAAIMPDAHLEIYQVAMEMERRGYDFYSSASQKVENEDARRLFAFLAMEEQRHFEIIQDTHDFLSNPSMYLAWEERWMQT